jgi:hypothetical protein
MSSSPRYRRDRHAARFAALALMVCAVQWLAATGASAADLTVVAALPPTPDRHVSLVVDTGAVPGAASVAVGGAARAATVTPVISDQLAVALVVDASQADSSTLQAWLSGATRFVLEAPAAARAVVIRNAAPPTVEAPLQQGAAEAVRALSGIRPHGARRTAEALRLATQQLGRSAAGPRLVLLYTTARDVDGVSANDLAARLLHAQALLVVVSTTADTGYWTQVTRATGGFLAPAQPSVLVPAMDQVAVQLRNRYLITFPAPDRLPAPVSVRIDTPAGRLTADTVVPVAPSPVQEPASEGAVAQSRGMHLFLPLALTVLALGVGAALVLARRRAANRPW